MARTGIKATGLMVDFQEFLDSLMGGLKAIEEDLDEALQGLLIKSSDHIKLSKKLEEIALLVDFLKAQDSNASEEEVKNHIKSMKRKIYECIEFLMDQVQKSMIKAVESLGETYDSIVMAGKLHKLLSNLESMEGMTER
ncbi:MAG: hypothetical protein DIU66_003325 [Bacillota bacterium]